MLQLNLNGQIATSEIDEGDINNMVTDIVVVFTMHIDVGYRDRSEGVL